MSEQEFNKNLVKENLKALNTIISKVFEEE